MINRAALLEKIEALEKALAAQKNGTIMKRPLMRSGRRLAGKCSSRV